MAFAVSSKLTSTPQPQCDGMRGLSNLSNRSVMAGSEDVERHSLAKGVLQNISEATDDIRRIKPNV